MNYNPNAFQFYNYWNVFVNLMLQKYDLYQNYWLNNIILLMIPLCNMGMKIRFWKKFIINDH